MRVKFLQAGLYATYHKAATEFGGPPAAGWKQSARQFEAGDEYEYPGQGQWYAQNLIDQGLAVGMAQEPEP